MKATALELFKNLALYEYEDSYYDFHNDYKCEKITYADGQLLIQFSSLLNGELMFIIFTEVKIEAFVFLNLKDTNSLTLDTLYRGRIETKGELIELSENGKGYFYLEFYEGQKLEFWAMNIYVHDGLKKE